MLHKLERFDFLIAKNQVEFLKTLPGNVSEHIRRALDEYIERLKALNASASESKKGGQSG